MYLRANAYYYPEHGVYCSSGRTIEDAQRAINQCRHGYYYRYPTSTTNTLNWAVEFGSEPLIITDGN